MEKEELAGIRDAVFSRIRTIVYDRYGEFIPASLFDEYSGAEASLKAMEWFESFKADADLVELFETFHRIMTGNYGGCLLCRKEIEPARLKENPVARFCDECVKVLAPASSHAEVEHL
jgi:hypothetical protein